MNITSQEYWTEVQSIAANIISDNKDQYQDRDELEEAINDTLLHEVIDGHQWVIYNSYNLDVYQHSDNQDYAIDNFGTEVLEYALKENGLSGLHTVLAYWCLYADVQDKLSDLLELVEYSEENTET